MVGRGVFDAIHLKSIFEIICNVRCAERWQTGQWIRFVACDTHMHSICVFLCALCELQWG